MANSGWQTHWHKHPGVRSGDQLTRGERAADRMRGVMGSWPFVFGFFTVMIIWAVVNTLVLQRVLHHHAFDPYPYILLNLFLSMLAGVQAAALLIAAKRADASPPRSPSTPRRTPTTSRLLGENTALTQPVKSTPIFSRRSTVTLRRSAPPAMRRPRARAPRRPLPEALHMRRLPRGVTSSRVRAAARIAWISGRHPCLLVPVAVDARQSIEMGGRRGGEFGAGGGEVASLAGGATHTRVVEAAGIAEEVDWHGEDLLQALTRVPELIAQGGGRQRG